MQRRISGAARFNRKNQKLAKALTASIESLERRQMLSVSAETLTGPQDAGDTWTYIGSNTASDITGTDVRTVIGKTTFMGNSGATEVDSTETNDANSNTDVDQTYYAFDDDDNLIKYGDVDTITDPTDDQTDTDTTTDSPPEVSYPAELTGGELTDAFTNTETDSLTTTGDPTPNVSTSTHSVQFELQSETKESLSVPAGTFNVYDVTVTESDQDEGDSAPTPTTSNIFIDPAVGIIELQVVDSSNTTTEELESYSLTGGGGGGGGGVVTPGVLTPAITKDTVPAAVVGGATLHGAALGVTLTNSGTEAEKGYTVDVFASTDSTLDTTVDTQVASIPKPTAVIGGHKSVLVSVPISELPASLNGTYNLIVEAVDSAGNSLTAISDTPVVVSPPFTTLTETLSTKLPAALVSDSPVKGGSVTLTITNNGNVPSKGVTPINVTASTTSGVIGTTIASSDKSLTILPGKSVKVTIPIKSTPALASDNYFIVAQTTDPLAADVSTVSSTSTTNIAAAFIMLAGTLGPANLKTGDTLTITNNGNVPYVSPTISGILGFSLDAAGAIPAGTTLGGAVKTPHIAVGKSAKIHLTEWKSILSSLTSGVPYYLTVTFADGNGGTVLAVSTTTFTL